MLRNIRVLACITAGIWMAGCADTSTVISPTSLRLPAEIDRIELSQPVIYAGDSKRWDFTVEYTLTSGIYTAWREDSSGVYYLGPGGCLTIRILQKDEKYRDVRPGDCGIFVPHTAENPMKVFVLSSAPTASDRKIKIHPEQPPENILRTAIVNLEGHYERGKHGCAMISTTVIPHTFEPGVWSLMTSDFAPPFAAMTDPSCGIHLYRTKNRYLDNGKNVYSTLTIS